MKIKENILVSLYRIPHLHCFTLGASHVTLYICILIRPLETSKHFWNVFCPCVFPLSCLFHSIQLSEKRPAYRFQSSTSDSYCLSFNRSSLIRWTNSNFFDPHFHSCFPIHLLCASSSHFVIYPLILHFSFSFKPKCLLLLSPLIPLLFHPTPSHPNWVKRTLPTKNYFFTASKDISSSPTFSFDIVLQFLILT